LVPCSGHSVSVSVAQYSSDFDFDGVGVGHVGELDFDDLEELELGLGHPVAVTIVQEVAQPMPWQRDSQGCEVNAVLGSLGHAQCWVRVLRMRQRGMAQVRQRLVVEVMVGQAVAEGLGGGVMVVL